MERRQLFAIKAAQEEEERQRKQETKWQEQVHLAAQEMAQAQQELTYRQWMSFPPGQVQHLSEYFKF